MYMLCYEVKSVIIGKRKFTVSQYFFKFYFVLVKGQSLRVTSKTLKGEVRGSIAVTWTVFKDNQSDVIGSATLYLGTRMLPGNELYSGLLIQTKQPLANEKFGNRIEAKFEIPKYTVTLSNLNYSDVSTQFTLTVTIRTSAGQLKHQARETVEITEVKGMYFFWKILHFVSQ